MASTSPYRAVACAAQAVAADPAGDLPMHRFDHLAAAAPGEFSTPACAIRRRMPGFSRIAAIGTTLAPRRQAPAETVTRERKLHVAPCPCLAPDQAPLVSHRARRALSLGARRPLGDR